MKVVVHVNFVIKCENLWNFVLTSDGISMKYAIGTKSMRICFPFLPPLRKLFFFRQTNRTAFEPHCDFVLLHIVVEHHHSEEF